MSLDLSKVASQVGDVTALLKNESVEKQKHLECALDVLSNQITDIDSLSQKILSSKTTWLVAGLGEGLAQHYEASPLPSEFTIIASDGSHIDVDRHRSTRCYLLNIGSVLLHYGSQPSAALDSFPHLYAGEEELAMTPPVTKGREQPIEGPLLELKRSVEECGQLARLAAALPPASTSLALLDGSLILWSLMSKDYPEFVTETLLDRGFLTYLEDIRKLNQERSLALASYISFPRSTDVINVLRVALCPHDPADCDRYCPPGVERSCDLVAGIDDRELFARILGQGERSAVFSSQSSIVQRRYGRHQVYFFYLRAEDEVARVEIPQWVATDKNLLGLAHRLTLDQSQRGQGYPVALSEAHEQAVVTEADRQNFWQLMESSLLDERLPALNSAKSRSKRTRWI